MSKLEELSERIDYLESETCGTGGCDTCKEAWLELEEVRQEYYALLDK